MDSIRVLVPRALQHLWAEEWIPYLSPPNQYWPQFIMSLGRCNFGNYRRTKNVDRVDLCAWTNNCDQPILSGEAKQYTEPLPLALVKGILQRVPPSSRLHIVLTKQMQTLYFRDESYETFAKPQKSEDLLSLRKSAELLSLKCFRFDVYPKPVLSVINGLPPTSIEDNFKESDRFVVFVCFSDTFPKQ